MKQSAKARQRRIDEFTAVYESTYVDLVRFIRRRMAPDESIGPEDVAAEAFAVAWRRWGERTRRGDVARPWLFGIARTLLLAQHRSATKHQALRVRLAQQPHESDSLSTDLSVRIIDVSRAWPLLSDTDQEALSLHILDDCSSAEAASVLGISAIAYRRRLSRARLALRAHLDGRTPPLDPDATTSLASSERTQP